jgi:3-hydroxymyristoyl/3-hydroxydecanoyl-(acyl carrier protein) dehydratase
MARNHPAFPGHFPAAPIVPGVLLLAESLRRISDSSCVPVQCRRIVSAKFFKPVGPGEVVALALGRTGNGAFTLTLQSAGELVAQATLELSQSPQQGSDV